MAMPLRKTDEAPRLQDIIARAMAEFDNDKDLVIEALGHRVRDPVLNEAFRLLGIQQAVRTFQAIERHRGPSTNVASADVISARNDLRLATKLFWDTHTLFGGRIVLKDATRSDLGESAREFGKLESGNRNMKEYHLDIGKRMPKDGTVGQHLAITKVVELARTHHIIP